MINLRILDGGLKKDILKSKDYNLYQNTDAKNLLFPGTLVEARVKKVLQNGLLVRFLSQFYGFIFVDHLENELESYKKKDLLKVRILASDFEIKLFHLSENPKIVNFRRMVKIPF